VEVSQINGNKHKIAAELYTVCKQTGPSDSNQPHPTISTLSSMASGVSELQIYTPCQ
jgi:hypothetical protein